MGGKQNRTRNNVRPSNSGRSAAMLHSSLPQFVGFSGGSKPAGLPSFAFNMSEEFDTAIDDNFQLVLKKVSKKDCTTKLKGLQEFSELLQKAELPIIKTLLPSWSRFYSVLVIHPENRIREAAQNAHHIILLKAKREIAPYLKQFMAPWYTSQYDNYPPAAAEAIQAFKDTFSPTKFNEAVIYCHQEILNYIHDNLIVHTAQTVSSSQLTPEEAEARYERVVISCLQGYAVYLKELPEDKITECLTLNTQIVSNKKFWKFAQSKIALIRSSWFQVLSVILQKTFYLLKGKEGQALSTILNNLDDEEPNILPHIWECLLLAISKNEWWKNVNIDQLFIPKILNVLKHGGRGNATIVYPNFLPLISKFPPLEEKRIKQFYLNFFESMTSSLKIKQIASSVQETEAISLAYVECLQYLISKNLSNILLCKSLIKQFCNLIEWCLTKEATLYGIIFNRVPDFVTFLTKNSSSDSSQILVEFLFNLLFDIFDLPLYNPNKVHISSVAKKQIELLLLLKSETGDSYKTAVENLGFKLFEMYMSHINQELSNDLFEPLLKIVTEFGKNILINGVLKQLDKNVKLESVDLFYWLKEWLLSDQMYCRSLLDLTFFLLEDMSDQDKEIVLNDLLEINKPNCLEWSVTRALSEPHSEDPVVQKWLKGEAVSNLFTNIIDKYIDNGNDSGLDILKLVLTENSQGELRINAKTLTDIIDKLTCYISTQSEENVNPVCDLAVDVCKAIYTKTHGLKYGDKLLLTLFKFSCTTDESRSISEETMTQIRSAWRNTIEILLKNLNVSDCKLLIEHIFESIQHEFWLILTEKRRGSALSNVIRDFIQTIYESRQDLLRWLIDYIFNKSWAIRDDIIGFCKVAEYIKGTLENVSEEILVNGIISNENILLYFIYGFLKIEILNSCEELEIEEDLGTKDQQCSFAFEVSEENLLEIIYSHAIADTFLNHFNSINHYNEILHYHCSSEKIICNMFALVEQDTLMEVQELLNKKILLEGWLWNKASVILNTKLLKSKNHSQASAEVVPYEETTDNSDNVEKVTVMFQQIQKIRNENLSNFLWENCNMSWEEANKIIETVKQCKLLIENFMLSQKHWDFVVLNLVTWTSNCLKARRMINQYQYQAMVVSVNELYIAICKKIEILKQEQVSLKQADEWEDVLLEGIHSDLAENWIYLAEHFSRQTENSLLNLPFLQCYGKVTDYFKHELLFKENSLTKWTKFLKISSITLLTNSQAVLQLWGYKMLIALLPGLVKVDEEAINTTTPHRNGLIFEQFKEKLFIVQDIVNSMLLEFGLDENSCKVEPSYDSFTYTLAYLLLWDIMIQLCAQASPELRYQYSDWLKNGELLQQFLSNLFKLMPSVLSYEGKAKVIIDNFLNNQLASADCTSCFNSETIENLACYLYKSSLEQFPALVRQWWGGLDIKSSQIVEKISSLYVSPHICNVELNNVLQHQNMFKNLKVKVMPTVREIQAVYTVDEVQMELIIVLPANYPLGSPDIDCNRQISGTSQKQWLLQFKKCVLHQNGKIWDGLSLWNSNLDRKFDGIEECYICYAVLHPGTYQLPKLSCRTCKKKFHSVCLYKWFSTSNKSSCPICRNLF